jgi:hypothetical protein
MTSRVAHVPAVKSPRRNMRGPSHHLQRAGNLGKKRISFRLARDQPDTIRVDATLYGLRLEIECFDDDQVKVSTFKGKEDIDGEYDFLLKMLTENSINQKPTLL